LYVNIPRGEAGAFLSAALTTRSTRKPEAGFDGGGGGEEGGRIGCVLRNCRDYGTAASAPSRDVSRRGGRRKGEEEEEKGERKRGRIAPRYTLDHFRRAEHAPMSLGYVPRYTERSLSPKMHIPGRGATPRHLTYKTVAVFQSSRNP